MIYHTLRGGAYYCYDSWGLRSSHRVRDSGGFQRFDFGFRLVVRRAG